ncbi:ABC transporter substrate-binding protein [Paenibacillus paeoniae]|uniref:Extracellular solute-binding protein n=1 Tax=Paenibacillus paeoniae TaxID=2292705 RepID=A0A371PJR8_9BACL|nr:extracellular solute-binding protein [Paenibacillus paeoniae]REK76175.1 extracellular solute-binding protein [Paenibacillus paeoniae]
MRKLALVVSVALLAGLIVYLYALNKQRFDLIRESPPQETIELWVSTPTLVELAEQYESKNANVRIKTRYFYNDDVLLEELYGAVSAGTPPDIAEIGSRYGIFPLIDMNHIVELGSLLPPDLQRDLSPGIASRFEYADRLWAWPLGYAIPVLYSNKSLLESNRFNLEGVDSWEQLWQFATGLMGKTRQANAAIWGVHADMQMPWYLMTMYRQHHASTEGQNTKKLTMDDFPEWERAVRTYKLIPPLTHQLAVSQFVKGEGGVLLSSSEKLPFYEKLIAKKFEMDVRVLPGIGSQSSQLSTDGSSYVAGGTGLSLFRTSPHQEESLAFIQYLAQMEQVVQFSLGTGYIPARQSAMQSEQLQRHYTQQPIYRMIAQEGASSGRIPVARTDRERWQTLQKIQEQIETEQ